MTSLWVGDKFDWQATYQSPISCSFLDDHVFAFDPIKKVFDWVVTEGFDVLQLWDGQDDLWSVRVEIVVVDHKTTDGVLLTEQQECLGS